jgi:hypothetical protein
MMDQVDALLLSLMREAICSSTVRLQQSHSRPSVANGPMCPTDPSVSWVGGAAPC